MTLEGEYEPSPVDYVRDQVEKYETTGGAEGGTMQGQPVVILTTKGNKSGKLRKTPLMRVEHDGKYAVIASLGGAPEHPVWYHNLRANPEADLQDGADVLELRAREVTGPERDEWWGHATEVWPLYDEYQTKTERVIPVLVLEPRS